jgi:hypothetical protein
LLTLLRRIRRRLRLWMAVEGAVAGAAAGAVALAGAVTALHVAGHAVGLGRPLALLAGSVAVGALARAARRIPLARCARFADAALDRQDRVLSAFCLQGDPSPLARALVRDAVERTRALAPGGAVSARRPKGLAALAMGALVLAAAAVAPVRSRAARLPVVTPPAPGAPLAAGTLDVEREEARRAAEAAARLHDERLATLAGELQRTLRRLAAGQLSDGEALAKLSALQREVAEAAAQAARDANAFEAAKKALEGEAATRGAGEVLSAEDADAARARAALGSAAAENPTETGRALSAAARGVASALGAPAEGGDKNPRRLQRESDGQAGAGASAADNKGDAERHLERLQRDLGDAASACRDGDPSCKSRAEKSGGDLGQMGGRGASAESLRQLERALRQMRDRLGRGEMRSGDQQAMRSFERAARGENGQPGQGGQGQQEGQQGEGQQGDGVGTGEGSGQGQGDSVAEGEQSGGGESGKDGKDGKDGKGGKGSDGKGKASGNGKNGEGAATAEGMALLGEKTVESTGSSAPGEGQGNGAGGPPLGKRGDMQTRGHETEARVVNGAGPNRAEVIGGAADRGFAQHGYARVFADYQAAVEDALATTAVPEGRRYVVRRYFDLIRPRTGKSTGKNMGTTR